MANHSTNMNAETCYGALKSGELSNLAVLSLLASVGLLADAGLRILKPVGSPSEPSRDDEGDNHTGVTAVFDESMGVQVQAPADARANDEDGVTSLDEDALTVVASFLDQADLANLGCTCRRFGAPSEHDGLSFANRAALRKLLLDHDIALDMVESLSTSTGMSKLVLLRFMRMVKNPSTCGLLKKLGFRAEIETEMTRLEMQRGLFLQELAAFALNAREFGTLTIMIMIMIIEYELMNICILVMDIRKIRMDIHELATDMML